MRHPFRTRMSVGALSVCLACCGLCQSVVAQPVSTPPPVALPPGSSNWVPFVYGFVDADVIWDSTQSFNDLVGNVTIARAGTYAGDNSRFTMSARHTRFGFKLSAPEFHGITASGLIEVDFLGAQPTSTTEAVIFSTPIVRMRHAFLTVGTPIVDMLMGQTWALFGWQGYFLPNTVELQGVPAEVYLRTPQLRILRVFRSEAVDFEAAIAATRPVQRDSGVPDGAIGLKLLVNHWKALRTTGATGSSIDAAGVGMSGLLRKITLPALSAAPTTSTSIVGWGVSADVLLPIIPATPEHRSNALTMTGSYVNGAGIADQYTSLTGGIGFPTLPNPSMLNPAPTYNPTIDPGIVSFNNQNKPELVKWWSFIVGLQYYLPVDNGHLWLGANYSQLHSTNAANFATAATSSKIFERSQWAEGDLFWDAAERVRFGLAFAWFWQKYVDGVTAEDERVQFSGYYFL